MEVGELYQVDGRLYKILSVEADNVLLIDCKGTTMPKWQPAKRFSDKEPVGKEFLGDIRAESELTNAEQIVARKRYSMIAGIVPYINDEGMRNAVIRKYAEYYGVHRRTITGYLCRYLVYEDIGALADRARIINEKPLTQDQKNIRWALNKYYYTRRKNTLTTAYIRMLKERYG